MNLDRNICSSCHEKNFSDDEYLSSLNICTNCYNSSTEHDHQFMKKQSKVIGKKLKSIFIILIIFFVTFFYLFNQPEHEYFVGNVIISEDGKYGVTSNINYTRLWDLKNKKKITEIRNGHTGGIHGDIGIDKNNERIISKHWYTIHITDFTNKNNSYFDYKKDLENHSNNIDITDDGKKAIVVSKNATIDLISLSNLQIIKTLVNKKITDENTSKINTVYDVKGLSLSNDGKFATSYTNNNVTCWDVEDNKIIHTLKFDRTINFAKMSKNGKYLLVAYNNHHVEYYDLHNNKLIHSLDNYDDISNKLLIRSENNSSPIKFIDISTNGHYAIIVRKKDDKYFVYFWNLKTRMLINILVFDSIDNIDMSGNGKYILFSDSDLYLYYIDLYSKKVIVRF